MASNFVLPDNFPSAPYQPLDYVFPKRFYSGKPRQFHSSWFKSWSWLHYDVTKDAVYCHTCVTGLLQKKVKASNVEASYVSTGYSNWKNATLSFKRHESSACHQEAVEMLITLPATTSDIAEQLSLQHSKQKEANRQIFIKILSSLRYLARQGLPLRGSGDDRDGNFYQLLQLIGDEIMSTIGELNIKPFIMKKLTEDNLTYEELSIVLKQMFPNYKGFSVRSLQRYCSGENIHKTSRLNDSYLNEVVLTSVMQVGATYGRKTMTGLLRSKGIVASEQRVGKVLANVSPVYHQARMTATARQTNPVPYRADYFGQKLHLDQNEKPVMYGITHICAVDGHTRMIVGFQTMCIKNNVEIYRDLYRPIISQYGLWDQLRVDHGREWYFILAVQQKLATLRVNQSRPSYLQTTSTMNHPVERIWVEINCRVNYPIKKCLINMEENNLLDMDNEMQKYCISQYTIRVSNVGTSLAVDAWNHHHIPGRGIPYRMMLKNSFTSMGLILCYFPHPNKLCKNTKMPVEV